MRNNIFQWLWFKIVKRLISVGKNGTKLENQADRMLAQIRLAKIFGVIDKVIFGDSNGAALAIYAAMKEFETLTINISVGGTTNGDWSYFLKTSEKGKLIYELIKDVPDQIGNAGGNYSILDRMQDAESGIRSLFQLFPRAWWCLCPPVREWMLEELSAVVGARKKTATEYHIEFLEINRLLITICKPKIIDLYTFFMNPKTGEEYDFALRDMAHYSRVAVGFIVRIIKET